MHKAPRFLANDATMGYLGRLGRGGQAAEREHMSFNRAAIAAVLLAGAGLCACSHASRIMGSAKGAPDEFRVVAKAPLIVPPDFSLRPPRPGEPRPQELQPESAARAALLGERQSEARSDGEKLLVARAGAERADPLIRYSVDDEFGDLAHKDKTFADKVMFWRKDPTGPAPTDPDVAAAAASPTMIDPAIEAKTLKSLVGDKPVIISRDKRGSFIKLPGL